MSWIVLARCSFSVTHNNYAKKTPTEFVFDDYVAFDKYRGLLLILIL